MEKAPSRYNHKSILSTLLTGAIASMLVISSARAATEFSNKVLSDLNKLASSEEGMTDSLTRLKSYPRPQVVQALRELMKKEENIAYVATGSMALGATELAPDFKKLAETSNDDLVIQALIRLTPESEQSAMNQLLIGRLRQTIPTATKITIIQSLPKGAVANEDFKNIMEGSEGRLQLALVHRFLEERTSYSPAEQLERMRRSLASPITQAKLQSLDHLIRLPKAERERFKGVFSPASCGQETDAKVKAACLQLARLLTEGAGK